MENFIVCGKPFSEKKMKNHLARGSMEYMPSNLKWYKRDGLLTYTDQPKYNEYAKNPQQYVDKIKFTSFDIIHSSVTNRAMNKTKKGIQNDK